MKILIIDWKSHGKEDIAAAFTSLGHNLCFYSHSDYDLRISDSFCSGLNNSINDNCPDMVFSSNFFPLVSEVCKDRNIPYASWVYDCPHVALYSATLINNINYVFLFDSEVYNELHNFGINNVYYLPLAASATRLATMIPDRTAHTAYDSDISFVGSMYNEEHNLFERFSVLSPYSKGYLDGIMASQLKISGYSFIENLLKNSTTVLNEIRSKIPYEPNYKSIETDLYIYSRYFVERKLTEIERTRLITLVSDNFMTKLYTYLPTPNIPNAINMGGVHQYTQAPYVFKCSKINLNITLRSIHNGIPLRAFEIMGSGGFLLSNFQMDFSDCFEADKDFVYYEDENDLIDKCRFYLTHEAERKSIASNGYKKIKADHNYEARLKFIIDTIFQ